MRRAVEVVPDWWGIRVARMEGADLAFSDLRLAFNNPAPDATSIARLLWRDEALNLLDKCGSATGVRSKGRTESIRDLLEGKLGRSPLLGATVSQAASRLAICRDTTVMWWLIPARSHISNDPFLAFRLRW